MMQRLVVVHLVAVTVLGKAARAARSLLGGLRALPARRAVIGAERGRGVEARRAVAAIAGKPAEPALRLGHLDIGLRQFVEEARRNVGLPQAVHAPVGGKID